jgi:sugar/nucleoside kinase (ribokinase family)
MCWFSFDAAPCSHFLVRRKFLAAADAVSAIYLITTASDGEPDIASFPGGCSEPPPDALNALAVKRTDHVVFEWMEIHSFGRR